MSDLFLLKNSEVLDLFEIKINDYEGYFRFHGSKNFNKDIVFLGQVYIYIPSEISNLEYSSDAKQNRPTLTISNVNNFITNFIKDRGDLLGKRFFRKKILAKDLDDENFGGVNKNTLGQGNFSSYIASDTFIIHKKNYETKEKVEFVLANILDLEGVTIPARKVYNDFCSWQYRGCGCNYGKIYGYDGPIIRSDLINYGSLTEINTEDPNNDLSSNLLVWLRPEGINTSGEIIMDQLGEQNKVVKTLKFPKVTSWTNEGTAAVSPDFQSTNPKKVVNQGRMNNQSGVYLSVDFEGGKTLCNPIADRMKINYDFSGTDVTIFYVAEMTNLRYGQGSTNIAGGDKKGGVVRAGLCWGASNSRNLGWISAHRDNYAKDFWINNARVPNRFLVEGTTTARNYIGAGYIFSLAFPKTNTDYTKFYSNGNNLFNEKIATGGTPTELHFNDDYCNGGVYAQSSEIIIYELIVYNKVLDDQTINKIHSYLGSKYNISVPLKIKRTDFRKGSSYFSDSDGNLGVPVADENNKIFLDAYAKSSARYSNYESYNLSKMTYKGIYDKKTYYNQGDFVRIENSIDYDFNEKSITQNNEFPNRFFVCVDINGSFDQHPFNNSKIWVEDKCSRNLNGCSLRFNDPAVNIPFGGFPGTVGYEYKLPGAS